MNESEALYPLADWNLGANLRAYRRRQGLSQKALAERVGMTQWAVYHNEKDDAEHISKKSLRRLAAALGVSLADLFLTPTSAVALRAANPLLDEVIELFLAIPSDRQEVYVTILRHITDRPPASTAPPRRSRPKHSRHQQSQGGIAGAQ